MTKIHGFHIYNNDSIDCFQVSLKKRHIEFNPKWKALLTEQEIEFCVRWAKIGLRKRTVDISEIDLMAIKWYREKFGDESFNVFLSKITNKKLYNRLAFSDMKLRFAKQKPSLWQQVKNFFAKKK
jgi:hypothetical protein